MYEFDLQIGYCVAHQATSPGLAELDVYVIRAWIEDGATVFDPELDACRPATKEEIFSIIAQYRAMVE